MNLSFLVVPWKMLSFGSVFQYRSRIWDAEDRKKYQRWNYWKTECLQGPLYKLSWLYHFWTYRISKILSKCLIWKNSTRLAYFGQVWAWFNTFTFVLKIVVQKMKSPSKISLSFSPHRNPPAVFTPGFGLNPLFSIRLHNFPNLVQWS